MSRLRRIPPWAALAALLAASTGARFFAALGVRGPWIAADEVIYAELGRSLWRHGDFALFGAPARFYSLVVPLVTGGPLSLGDPHTAYWALKLVQALVMSLTAVPVYLWARELGARGWALAAAALTLALPGLAYSGLVMSEVEFLPVATLAAWALARALARPTAARQALLVGALALAVATRLQALVLVPVLLTAVAAKAALDRDARSALRLAPALAAVAATAGGYAAWRLAGGGPASELLGAYRAAGEVGYGAADAARFALYHAADAVLLVAVAPFCAVALLILDAARGRERSPEVRAYAAVAAALVPWLVVEVGVFASRHVGRLAERDLLALAPVLLVGFGAWLARGAPRRRVPAAAAAAVAVALAAALPAGSLVSEASIPDAFTTIPLWRLQVRAPSVDLRLAVVAAAAVAAAAFLLLRPRALAAFCLVALAAVSVSTSRVVAAQSTLVRLATVGRDATWIDGAAGGPVAYVYSGETNWNAVWFNAFWNRRVDRVLGFVGARVPHLDAQAQPLVGPLPDGRVVSDPGREPVAARWVVAADTLAFAGEPAARAPIPQLTLWRASSPLRVLWWAQPPRDGHAYVQAFACRGATLELRVEAPAGRRVTVKRNGRVALRFVVPAGGGARRIVAARPPGRPGETICTFNVDADGPFRAPVLRVSGR